MMTAVAVSDEIAALEAKGEAKHQESVLQGMTPDKAITLCGKPMWTKPRPARQHPEALDLRNDYALAVEGLNFAASTAGAPNLASRRNSRSLR